MKSIRLKTERYRKYTLRGGAIALLAAWLVAVPGVPAVAQPATNQTAQPTVPAPGFWDPRRRPERPDISRITLIRFLTEFDYPPFNYAGPDGNPAGFNVDLARHDLRGAEDRLHHPDAPLRYAAARRSARTAATR